MYNEIGDSMAYLCFADGRDQDKIVKIFEGKIYEIDRLTSTCIDSDDVRRKYEKQLHEFKTKYPDAKNGSVRIFGEGVYSENGQRVLYKKHKVAFEHIIKDTCFLRWFAMQELRKDIKDRLIYDIYVLRGIAQYRKEITRINQFLKTIKQTDRANTGLKGGAENFYRFMRALLNCYEDYRKSNDAPSIDDIWKEYLEKLSHTKLEHKAPGENIVLDDGDEMVGVQHAAEASIGEENVDAIYYDVPPIYGEPLYDFFTSDYFAQGYSHIFEDNDLVIAYDLPLTNDIERVNPWQVVASNCYNGTTYVRCLSQFTQSDTNIFNGASVVIFYGEKDTLILRNAIIRAITNKAEVILISESSDLIDMYSREFKSIITILESDNKNNTSAKRQLVDVFIEMYQSAKGIQKK